MRADVVVVGGGVSGLVAARRLGRAGARVTLVERSKRLGGMVVTHHEDGFVIEKGPDSFVAPKASVLGLARELGIDGEVVSTRPEHRGSYVWWDGELHPLPGGMLLMVPSRIGPLLRSSLLSWPGKARALADLVIPRRGVDGDESLASFVTRRLGHEVLERVAEPLIAGIHAAEPETMSLLASFPRLLEMEGEHRSLILAARATAPLPAPTEGLSHFASFGRGMGLLVSALAEDLGDAELRTSTGVVAVTPDASRYRVVMSDGSEVEADAVVLAVPAPVAAKLLEGVAREASEALAGIHRVAAASVTLAYETDDLPALAGSGFVVPAVQRRRIGGVSYVSRKWAGRVPDPGFALLRVFIRGSVYQGTTGDRLRAVAQQELAEMLGITARPRRAWVQVFERGLHRYTMGHLDRVETAERALLARPGLVLAGAGFHGIGLNECIDSGHRAAESVVAALSGAEVAVSSGEAD